VVSLAVSSNTVYAGGDFTTAGGVPASYIAQWNGGSWSALGSGMDRKVRALAVSGNTLYAGGDFTLADGASANHVARWNGASWLPLSSGVSATGSSGDGWVYALAASDDALYAAGYFRNAGGVAATNIARWNGNSWSALGSGISGNGSDYLSAVVWALALSGDDNLYAGGNFSVVGTNGCAFVAEALFSRSSHDLALKRLGGGTNIITGFGTPGYSYALDLATNLTPPIDWIPQTTNTQPGVNLVFTNLNASSQAIYRTRYVSQ
jgi:hypothetical protein